MATKPATSTPTGHAETSLEPSPRRDAQLGDGMPAAGNSAGAQDEPKLKNSIGSEDSQSIRTLEAILELARWAPSADNTQPWRF